MSSIAAGPEAGVDLDARTDDGVGTIRVRGPWTLDQLAALEPRVAAAEGEVSGREFTLDGAGLTGLDTAGAWLLARLRHAPPYQQAAPDAGAPLSNFSAAHALLVTAVAAPDNVPRRRRDPLYVTVLGGIGQWGAGFWRSIIAVVDVFGAFCAALLNLVAFRRRMRWAAFFHHLDHAGLRAVPIVALMSFIIGVILAQQGAFYFRDFGIELFVVDLVGVLTFREVGVLLTSIMVAGRSGSAFTAEIGSMKMREEVDALVVLGVGPVDTLVVPRLLALVCALPILTFVSDLASLLGAWVVTSTFLDIPTYTFLARLREAVSVSHLVVGLAKAPVMALIIGLIACVEGLRVAGSAELLGRHTTTAVVKAIFMVIVLDGVFAIVLGALGI